MEGECSPQDARNVKSVIQALTCKMPHLTVQERRISLPSWQLSHVSCITGMSHTILQYL